VETINRFQTHLSDTVRGWVCYAIAQDPTLTIEQQLTFIKPLANDKHFGVREWAWLAVRPQLVSNLTETLALLTPWVVEESEYLRRFATEATRPRGVWCKQIPELKANPEWGLPLLTPLRSDALRYVQDSVGNWLNDASKTQPHWVKALCDEWLTESPTKETHYICKKALRPLK
jgi:3-methyladenine DNA glycosylase AlkC